MSHRQANSACSVSRCPAVCNRCALATVSTGVRKVSGRCAACDIWLGFGSSFNQGREDITSFRSTLTLCHIVCRLQTSSFCLCFHQSLGGVKLPSCLLTMFFDLCSSQNLQGISLRSCLCTSSFGYSFSQKHEGFTSFANLHTLCHVVLPSADIEPYPLSHPGYEERQVLLTMHLDLYSASLGAPAACRFQRR